MALTLGLSRSSIYTLDDQAEKQGTTANALTKAMSHARFEQRFPGPSAIPMTRIQDPAKHALGFSPFCLYKTSFDDRDAFPNAVETEK